MEPITIGLIVSVAAAGTVALGSLIASVCTYFSFKDSASASSSDEQCVQVDNEVTKKDQNGNTVTKKQHIKIHNTCLESMQRSTHITIPVENKTANIVGGGAVNALGGIAGGLGGALGGTDFVSQMAGIAGNIASVATNGNTKDEKPEIVVTSQISTLPPRGQKQDGVNQPDPKLLPTIQKQKEDNSESELVLYNQYGKRVYIDITQNGSDIELNLYDEDQKKRNQENLDEELTSTHKDQVRKNLQNSKGKQPYYSNSDYESSETTVESEEEKSTVPNRTGKGIMTSTNITKDVDIIDSELTGDVSNPAEGS